MSIAESSIVILKNNLNSIIESNPELVIIEFGMNYHIWVPDIESFIKKIELIITEINTVEIDCIFVGFFNRIQNGKWNQSIRH